MYRGVKVFYLFLKPYLGWLGRLGLRLWLVLMRRQVPCQCLGLGVYWHKADRWVVLCECGKGSNIAYALTHKWITPTRGEAQWIPDNWRRDGGRPATIADFPNIPLSDFVNADRKPVHGHYEQEGMPY
jgi:hypothetical protein